MTATPLSRADAGRFRLPLLRPALRLLSRWRRRHRQRVDLAELDDHLLADIGRTRAEARRECARPFWR
jgi:uncharacterized protein YjiS (DUF1127 family)